MRDDLWRLSVLSLSEPFSAEYSRATLAQPSQAGDYLSEQDSLLFLQQFPKYSRSFSLCEFLHLFNPPFSITWSDLLCAVAVLSPCPCYLSPSQSWLANSLICRTPRLSRTLPRTGFWADTDTIALTGTQAHGGPCPYLYSHTFRVTPLHLFSHCFFSSSVQRLFCP